MTSALVALATVLLAGVVALGAYAGLVTLTLAVALVVLGIAAGWGLLLELAHVRGTAIVVAISGWAAAAAAYLTSDRTQPLGVFSALVAGSVLLAFAHELFRRDGRHSLVESITGTLSGQVIAVLGAGWILMPSTRLGNTGVLVGAVAAAVSALATALPLDPAVRGWVGFGAGTGAAAVTALVAQPSRIATCVILGVAVAAVVAGLGRLLGSQPLVRTPLGLAAAAAAPVCAVGTVAYAVARLAS